MSLSILIVTPQTSFAQQIRQTLEEKYPCHIVTAEDVLGALYAFEKENFTHAILDTKLRNGTVLELGLALRRIDPGLLLTLISAESSPPPYEALEPWTLLRKPFKIPDLLRIMNGEAEISVALPAAKIPDASTPESQEDVTWLKDVSRAAQHLTRLTLESSAQAALIIRESALWAYSGQLSQPAAAELVGVVSKDKKSGDLLKFIQLDTTQAEHMLYATELAKGMNLAMVFDAETPFSTIRSQASHLAEALSFSPPTNSLSRTPPSPEATSLEKESEPDIDDFQKEHDELQSLFDFGDASDEKLPPITQILENIPAPNPTGVASNIESGVPLAPPSAERSALQNEPMPDPFGRRKVSAKSDTHGGFAREASPAMRLADTQETNVVVEETHPQVAQPRPERELGQTRVSKSVPRPKTPLPVDESELAATRVSRAIPRHSLNDLAATRVSKSVPRSKPIDLAATRVSEPVSRPPASAPKESNTGRPHSITEVAGRVLAEPGTAGMYDLTYACLLLPRFANHHLTGDLADRLSEWMPNISVAFGWRLEYISVRPDYLQWVINVPPTASPGYLMRIIRKQTSERIFEDFPRLKRDNPSGDFWAPGYLIMGGSQPHPSQLVKDYIQRTRERQGTA